MFIIAVAAKIWPSVAPREPAPSWRVRFLGLLALLPVIALMFIVLGTIYLGVATPTEAAAFGVVASFILAALSREVSLHMLKQVMVTTVRTSSMIMLIVTSAFILSFALAILGVPAQLTELLSGWKLTPLTFVLILVVFYLILGTFMEALSMMVTTMPILVPLLKSMGVDLVWFGIIMVILLEAALVSPPGGPQPLHHPGDPQVRLRSGGPAGRDHVRPLDRGAPVHGGHGHLYRPPVHVPRHRPLAPECGDGEVSRGDGQLDAVHLRHRRSLTGARPPEQYRCRRTPP